MKKYKEKDWFSMGGLNIWLPYTQMKKYQIPLKVITAEGCYIVLENNVKLLDSTSSWWSACHGYGNSHINQSIKNQLDILPHIMFSGLAHEQSYKLASRLVAFSPRGLEKVFFSDSGSTAVEVAMKVAVQYYKNLEVPGRNRFVFFEHGYHGDTMGCMSISDPRQIHGFTFAEYQPQQYMLKLPRSEEEFSLFTSQIKLLQDKIAAIVIEPILQAAGGMKIHSGQTLKRIYNIAQEHNILFIADEVATGFGRTGSLFACNEAEITPDIMVVGKALTGGFCTLAATITTQKVFDAFLSDSTKTALMHGPTFMANPMACAAANASLDLFQFEPRMNQVFAIEQQLKEGLNKFHQLNCVEDVRVKGAVGIIELNNKVEINSDITKQGIDLGVWIRPLGNVIYLMPPFIITREELSRLIDAIFQILLNISVK